MALFQTTAGGAPAGSLLLRTSFVVLALAVATLFVSAVFVSALGSGTPRMDARRLTTRVGLAVALWLAVTAVAARQGLLHFEPPPTMLAFFAVVFAMAFTVAFSRLGTQLALGTPLAWLVGFQGFRVLVELLLHRAYVEGLMPVQMSYVGRNFDILTGLTAIPLGAWLLRGRFSARVLFAWNTLGVALLLNILTIAILSAPTPFRKFMNEPSNAWVARAPWVWLPGVMVLAAILGHVLVYRRLWLERSSRSPARVAAAS